jgi:LPS sulfotransferase NodH
VHLLIFRTDKKEKEEEKSKSCAFRVVSVKDSAGNGVYHLRMLLNCQDYFVAQLNSCHLPAALSEDTV